MNKEEKKQLKGFENILGYSFKKKEHLKRALTHKSYANEKKMDATDHNERYEFLGDAVLELIVSHLLMERFGEHPEGELSKLRAAIVNETQLADLARKIHLGKFLFLGKGEEATGGREKPSLLSDSFEAVLAAIYLDRGFKKVFGLVEKFYDKVIDHVGQVGFVKDYKTRLQEVVQGTYKTIPQYQLVKATGPDHSKTFEVEVCIQDKVYAIGYGSSKKSAEQDAAHHALKKLTSGGH